MQEADCGINNCMAFIGPDSLRCWCSLCWEFRYFEGDNEEAQGEFYSDILQMFKRQAKAHFLYLPIIPRLRLLFANKHYAQILCYPTTLEDEPWPEGLHDVWDAEMMKKWKREGMNTRHYSD